MTRTITTGFLSKVWASDAAVLGILAALKLLIPLLTHPDFEFHRDEFLYLAMGEHLSWGYLEVPPFIGLLAWVTRTFLGEGLYAVRFLPALSGALTLFLTGWIARELGGNRFAQILAALAYLFSLLYLRINLFFMPVTFDLFFFVLGVYLLIRILKNGHPSYWLVLGVVMGVGLLNKYTMLLFGFGLAVGLLFTPYRRFFRSPWPWLSALIALLIWLPNLWWQHQQGWPFFEHMRVLSERQLANVEPLTFLLVQILMNLYATPIWILGLYFFFSSAGRAYRPLGWMYLAILTSLLVLSGKIYYSAPAYPMLIAGGAVALEGYIRRTARRRLKPAVLFLVIVGSATLIPVGIPLFSVKTLIAYFDFGSRYMGLAEARRWETGRFHELPQDYADMLGWREMAATVAETYHALPAAEKKRCAIFAANYGEAGAIDHYGPAFGLPAAISSSSSYWLWGYGDTAGDPLIAVGLDKEDIQHFYNRVRKDRVFRYPHARESGIRIHVARQPKMSLDEMWQILGRHRY